MALFAALSYAVTQSGRGGGNIDREQEELDLAVNEQCIGLVEYGENQLKIFNGCADDQISYELPNGGNPNPLAPSDRSCHVFDEAGAGITPCGSFLNPFGIPIVSMLTFGDTTNGVILPGGNIFRCQAFNFGRCGPYEISFDNGFTFHASNTCLAQDNAELASRGGFTTLRDEFIDSICLAACGGTGSGSTASGGNRTVTNGGYFRPDGIIEPYSGSCVLIPTSLDCTCF